MLDFLRDKASGRKLILFAVACYRRIAHFMDNEEIRCDLEEIERLANGNWTDKQPERGLTCAWEVPRPDDASACIASAAFPSQWRAAVSASRYAANASGGAVAAGADIQAGNRNELAAQSMELRDIFGNPFRPLPPRPDAIAPLAEGIYAGLWDLMPLLGEWLQERGFWSEGEHCLDPNVKHVKGCWVVDWVLGKE
jgi:hypothetical protein